MATYDASAAAGQIYPIVGAGIGLGLLAGMSRGVMDTMFPSKHSRRSLRRPVKRQSQYNRRGFQPRPYRGQQRRPQYGYWR